MIIRKRHKTIKTRSLGHILLHEFLAKRKSLDSGITENSTIRSIARYFTTGILIIASAVATGMVFERGCICYSK